MDAAAHYRHLLALGREEFLAAAAPAVLVRYRAPAPDPSRAGAAALTTVKIGARSESMAGEGPAGSARGAGGKAPRGIAEDGGEEVDDAMPHGTFAPEPVEMELYPLAKKPGASFRDRITIGRTPNNDVVIADPSVSRLHAYVRQTGGWIVADAGSKNGSWLDGVLLEPRRETALPPGATLRFGDVELKLYRSEDLFDLMGGDDGRQ